MNFKKMVWQLAKESDGILAAAPGGEGLVWKIDSISNAYIHLNGSWSHIEAYYGFRNTDISNLVQKCMDGIPNLKMISLGYSSKLTGIFNEKIGDFCHDIDDIGKICPTDSHVLKPSEVLNVFSIFLRERYFLFDPENSLEYVLDKDLITASNYYYVLATCAYLKNIIFFERTLNIVEEKFPFILGDDYHIYTSRLKNRFFMD